MKQDYEVSDYKAREIINQYDKGADLSFIVSEFSKSQEIGVRKAKRTVYETITDYLVEKRRKKRK